MRGAALAGYGSLPVGLVRCATAMAVLLASTPALAQEPAQGGSGGQGPAGAPGASLSNSGPAGGVVPAIPGAPSAGERAPSTSATLAPSDFSQQEAGPLLPESEAMVPLVQPSVQLPVDQLPPDAVETVEPPVVLPPTPLAGTGPTRAGQAPLATVRPVPTSVAEQIMLGTPVLSGEAAEGLVQANPRRILGDAAPWLTGLAVSAVRGLEYSASLRTEYNDNFRRGGRLGDDGDTRTSEWRFTPELGLAAGHELGRHLLFANANFGWDFHAHNTDRDHERVNLTGGLQWVLGSRCGGRVQGGYSTRENSFDAFDELDLRGSSVHENIDLTLSAACRLAGRLTGNIAYDWSKETRSGAGRGAFGKRRNGFVGGLSYPIGTRGSLSASGFVQKSTYPDQILFTGEKNGQKFKGFTLGTGYSFGPAIGVNGSIGKTWVSSRNPLTASFSGLSWSLGTSYSGPRFGASLSASRSASSGSGSGATFSIGNQRNANISYNLNPRMNVTAGYLWSRTRYQELLIIPGLEDRANRRTNTSWLLGTNFQLNRMISTSLDYRHRKTRTDVANRNYSANIVTFTIGAGF